MHIPMPTCLHTQLSIRNPTLGRNPYPLKERAQDWAVPVPDPVPLRGSFLQELQCCDTDDDVAMCFIKNQEAFEKYLEFLVGRVQAESVVVSTAVQEFYKVPLPGSMALAAWPLPGHSQA